MHAIFCDYPHCEHVIYETSPAAVTEAATHDRWVSIPSRSTGTADYCPDHAALRTDGPETIP